MKCAGLAAILLGWSVALTAQAADPAKCQMLQAGELAVKFRNNRPLAEVKINGKSAWFLVDTGAGVTTMFAGAAQQLGLGVSTDEGLTFSGVGGVQEGKFGVVKEFVFAGNTVKNLKMWVVGGTNGSLNEAGLLGDDFLGHFDLEFDLAHNVIRLFTPKHCGTQSLSYWTDQPAIEAELVHDEPTTPFFLMMQINGKRFRAQIDSGAQTSVITALAARELGVGTERLVGPVESGRGIGAARVDMRVGVFDKVTIGGEQIAHAKLQVADLFKANKRMKTGSMIEQHIDDPDEPGMLLGADYLRAHRVLLSTSQKVFYATYNGGPIFQVIGSAGASQTAAPAPPPPAEGAHQ